MREDLLVRRMREAIRKGAKRSPEERFQAMVEAGIIDEKGRVLVRMPEPPKMKHPKKKKKPKANSPPPAERIVTDAGPNGEACFMSEEALLQRMQQAISNYAKVPAEERHQALVEAGIIDEEGRVLVRMPEPPKIKRASKKKPKASS